jgi:hypothetical protein
MSDYILSEEDSKTIRDLFDQAEMYDLEVDWETLELLPKRSIRQITYWGSMNELSSDDPYFDQDWSKDER